MRKNILTALAIIITTSLLTVSVEAAKKRYGQYGQSGQQPVQQTVTVPCAPHATYVDSGLWANVGNGTAYCDFSVSCAGMPGFPSTAPCNYVIGMALYWLDPTTNQWVDIGMNYSNRTITCNTTFATTVTENNMMKMLPGQYGWQVGLWSGTASKPGYLLASHELIVNVH